MTRLEPVKLGYSVREAALALGLGRSSVYDLIQSGELESVKVGRRRIVPAEALTDWMSRVRKQQNGQPQ